MGEELRRRYDEESNIFEICMDEAGRGCLFGRVYIASVVLPKDPILFNGKDVKDSKKFSSKRKLKEVADYIKTHAFVWNISYIESTVIDEINILQSVMRGMHECIGKSTELLREKGENEKIDNCLAVVDGNYFVPYRRFDGETETIREMSHITVEKGDGIYMGIAAASILAKNARDEYIEELCKTNPDLSTRYGINTNMGYGTKKHLEGIAEHGITQWHRRTFGAACKNAKLNEITN